MENNQKTDIMGREKKKKRSRRGHYVSREYLMALADKIHSMNPTKEIVYNSLKEVYELAYEKGYIRHIEDAKVFKNKMAAKIKAEFDNIRTSIDDEIHSKNQ